MNPMLNPEKIKIETGPEIKTSREKRGEKLKNFIELISSQLRKEGVPVDSEARIDMDAFKKRYSKEALLKDKERIAELKKRWYGDLSEKEIQSKKMKSAGERMEMLKTAIFYKNLSPDFIVARTSSYDDIERGVDNLILEKETGNLVCAFDEVADLSGLRYREKRDKIVSQNIRGGKYLKYALKMERNRKNEMKLNLEEVKSIPIFYLALSPADIEKGMKNFEFNLEKQSDYEKKLFAFFLDSLNPQIELLKINSKYLDPELKKHLLTFERALEKLGKSETKT